MKQDIIQNFIFKDRNVRGSFVRLNQSYKTIVNQHHYPPILSALLGETLLGACLISPFFKTPGKITLQFQGTGGLQLLSARITSDFAIRGLVRAEPELITDLNLLRALQEGQLSLSYEPEQGRAYQSFIAVQQTSIAKTLEDYFTLSEQLPTRFFLASTEDAVAGIMLQLLPNSGEGDAYQDFEHCSILASTVKAEELLILEPSLILQRLFPEDDVTVFPEKKIEFGCNCSRERMSGVVLNLGMAQATSILEEHGFVEVTCEFCGQAHQFNQEEVMNLFTQKSLGGTPHQSTRPHLNG